MEGSSVAKHAGDVPDFGKNVIILDHAESADTLKAKINHIRQISQIQIEDGSEFAQHRYAILFKSGTYDLYDNDVGLEVGYYMTVHGLGDDPGKVIVNGQVQAPGSSNPRSPGLALNNFWRGVENLTIKPMDRQRSRVPNRWAVSQATFMRRVHLMGDLDLFAPTPGGPAGFASGGFIADSFVDNTINSASQQQFLTRNVSQWQWNGGVWNMVFVGGERTPAGSWPNAPYTTIEKTPVIREKPFLTCSDDGKYSVQVPQLRRNSSGVSWPKDKATSRSIPISHCFIAKAGTMAATAAEMNKMLAQGHHLILTPGVYHLDQSLVVNHPDTVILGLGMATLVPDFGKPAMMIADVGGVSVSGIIFDAGPVQSPSLLIVGYDAPHGVPGADHRDNPTALFDCSARVGDGGPAKASNCFTINTNDVLLDNVWLWRADHGRVGTHDPSVVGWNTNPAENGLTVNGDRVIAYGLFVEHFEGYQTIWNGNDGQVYFYQSEIPYDVPSQMKWTWHAKQKGYASYKVSDQVSSHTSWGMGIYCNFWYHHVELENAIEVPDLTSRPKIDMNNMCTVWLDGADDSRIVNVVGGQQADGWRIKNTGSAVSQNDQAQPSRVMKLEVVKR